ncbi:hypothetical protein GCM10012275_54310 [Longimycelium tulufanense]|uniref:Uncharacterized protein n=1 Tax=Longimycelium tulufanense TaxID=907463 RepID=A0A8J3CHP0_9PSEU|nr:lanthionine synthetase C family protein [Longimycelium tulufanense]GGM76763.1 hypothetical protein GCM10012275_54310 [Longimycelium tulufanense]
MIRPQPQALAAASAIAERLTDPSTVPAGVNRNRPQSLAGGFAGIALLHIERALSGHGDWYTADAWLAAAAAEPLSAGGNASLYFGAPAVGFVAHAAAAGRPGRLTQALERLDADTLTLTRRRLDHARTRLDRGERPVMAEFDLIRGLAGLAADHLRRHPDHEITRDVLAYLVRLTEPVTVDGQTLPGWWVDVAPNGEVSPEFPGGHGNLGMSHGIAAPLAVLSLAMRWGVVVDGHSEAIVRICAWLDFWQQDDPHGPWWPGFVTAEHARKGTIPLTVPRRPDWCYRTPGIARAQQLAGIALHDDERQRRAEGALLACLRDPDQLALVGDIGLCHGTAGLLQVTWRMATDAATPDLADELPGLVERLIGQLDTAHADPELLDGLAGVALALHTAGTGTAPRSGWDACLSLA